MSVILAMVARYAMRTFTVRTVRHAVFQSEAMQMDIMTATSRMAVRLAFRTGTDKIVACIVQLGMTRQDITSAMQWTGVGAVWMIGTVLTAPYNARHRTHPRVITHVTLETGAEYVFQAGLGSSATRVSFKFEFFVLFFLSTHVGSTTL